MFYQSLSLYAITYVAVYSLMFMLLIPVGVRMGVWLNKRVPEVFFLKLVYGLTFVTGLELMLNLGKWMVK
jgi:uncharacterized membrane protein YfcA